MARANFSIGSGPAVDPTEAYAVSSAAETSELRFFDPGFLTAAYAVFV
jgi:hypothetical protein